MHESADMKNTPTQGLIQRAVLIVALSAGLLIATVEGLKAAGPLPLVPTTATASQETQAEVSAEPTRQEVRDMVSRLSDREVRRIRELLPPIWQAAERVPAVPGLIWGQVTKGGTIDGGRIAIEIVVLLLLGWLAEHVYRRTTVSVARFAEAEHTRQLKSRAGLCLVRAVLDLVGIAIFGLVVTGLLVATGTAAGGATRLTMAIVSAIVAVRLVAVGSRFVLAPKISALRLVPLSDGAARGIHWRLLILVTIIAVNRQIGVVLWEFGVDANVWWFVSIVKASFFVLVLLVIVAGAVTGRGPHSRSEDLTGVRRQRLQAEHR